MMTDKELKEAIARYVKEHYERNREAPSLGKIVKRFRGEKLSLSRLYRVFPKGVSEVCKLAGVPVPTLRMKRTEKATKATKSKQQVATVETPGPVTELSFSQIYFIDGDRNRFTLDELSQDIYDHLFDLDNTLISFYEKIEEKVTEKVMEMIHPNCHDCGNKLALKVFCPHCETDFTVRHAISQAKPATSSAPKPLGLENSLNLPAYLSIRWPSKPAGL